MAVGADYSLFYVRRTARNARGASRRDAIDIAAATSGRAVVVSGIGHRRHGGVAALGNAVFSSTTNATSDVRSMSFGLDTT